MNLGDVLRCGWRVLCAMGVLGFGAAGGAQTRAADAPKAPVKAPGDFANPVLWEDLADIDVLRVGDMYYYSASNMHYSPGAPILQSADLVHWEYVGHSIPVLDFSPAYDMEGGRAYVKGSWASFLGYRKSNATFYWGGCIEFKKTHLYSAKDVKGPWTKLAVLDNCYYDAGLLIDDDDTIYVAYGNTKLSVAQLSPDGRHEVRHQQVFETPPDVGVLEGSRFYKVHGDYYIFATRPANGEYVLRSTTGPFGPYTMHKLLLDTAGPIAGGGVPHQGGIVQTQRGDWYYMAFQDAFPGGRVPVLAPLLWDADGWPRLEMPGNRWAVNYPYPATPGASHVGKPLTGTERFLTKELGPEWEWNHNPDNRRWAAAAEGGEGLRLETATVTDDLYGARDTLTHRILGPSSTVTVVLDVAKMRDGDRAGLAMLRDASAWVGVSRDAGALRLVMKTGLAMDRQWNTTSTGEEVATVPVKSGRVWLRAAADIRPGKDRVATFAYSLDGRNFRPLGTPYVLNTAWQFFMGYRFGIFNYATKELGGSVLVRSFTLATP